MLKKLTACCLLLCFAISAQCQVTLTTVHVRSTRAESRDEVSPGQMRAILGSELVYTLYTVESGNLIYTLESADNRQPEVGKDYQVKKATRDEMVLLIPGKKRPVEVSFHIKEVSEKPVPAPGPSK